MKEWFVKKGPGIFFVPVTWQGWVSVIVMLALLITTIYLNKAFTSGASIEQRVRLMFEIVVVLIISVLFFDSHAKKLK